MKSSRIFGAIVVSMTLSGAALAADVPPPPPEPVAVVDPLTAVLTPIGNAVHVVAEPVIVAPVTAVTAVLVPPPPPPAEPAPVVHHRRHHRHHKAM